MPNHCRLRWRDLAKLHATSVSTHRPCASSSPSGLLNSATRISLESSAQLLSVKKRRPASLERIEQSQLTRQR